MKVFRDMKSAAAAAGPQVSLAAKLTVWITIASTLLGGAWILFQSIYTKQVEPRLTPAVVQIAASAEYVGDTDCCRLYQVTTTLQNKGHRAVFVHGSHQVVSARRLATHDDTTDAGAEKLIRALQKDRSIEQAEAPHMRKGTVDYVFPVLQPPLMVVSIGNLLRPGSALSPGEAHTNSSIAAIPKSHISMSIRGVAFVSHFKSDSLEWRWRLDEDTGEPLALPWPRGAGAELAARAQCANNKEEDLVARRQCARIIQTTGQAALQEYWESDSHSYSQHYAADLIARPPEVKPTKQ